MTVLLQPIEFVGNMTLSDNLTLSLSIQNFTLNFDRVIDSQIGNLSYPKIEGAIALIEEAAVVAIDIFFGKPRSLYPIIEKLGITFVDLNKTNIETMDGFFKF